jgi:hypothetical protein
VRDPALVACAAVFAALSMNACDRDPPPDRGGGPLSAKVVDHLEEESTEPVTMAGSPTPSVRMD